jgi:ABC-2 type transport system permease protein
MSEMLRLLRLDAIHLMRERVALWALVVGLAVTLLAVWSGHAWLQGLNDERVSFLAEHDDKARSFRETLLSGKMTPEQLALAPVRVAFPLAYPLPPLADFTIGRSDIEPATAVVRMRYRSDTLFRVYQTDNPERLVRGQIDMSFVVVVVAPLLLIALGYGLFTGDRDRGTAQIMLAQAGSPLKLLAARSLNRLALVSAPILAGGVMLVALGPDPVDRFLPALKWIGIALLSLVFWQALILFVNALRIGSEAAALLLVGLWTLLVFLAPAVINAAAQYAFPPPSRLALIVESRAAEVAATGTYENDHPELAADPSLPTAEQYRRTVARNIGISRKIERRIAPLMARFDQQLSQQMEIVETAQLLSPPMTFSGLLAVIAGTDAKAYAQSRRAAFRNLADFKRTIAVHLAGRKEFTLSELDALPRYVPPPPASPGFMPLMAAFAFTLALWYLAWRLYRRTLVA